MAEIFIDTYTCRIEAERLRRTAEEVQSIKSRLISLAGATAEAWQGSAANALADTQEYTLREFTHFISLIEEVADNIDSVVTAYEQADTIDAS